MYIILCFGCKIKPAAKKTPCLIGFERKRYFFAKFP